MKTHSLNPRSRSSLALAVVLSVALALAVVAAIPVDRADAADGSTFDPGLLITDEVFFNGNGMTRDEIQSFLSDKGKNCVAGEMPCLKDAVVNIAARSADLYCRAIPAANGVRVGDLIAAVSQACSINPQVLLVLLEKEQSLVTRTKPTTRSYNAAVGFACPDTGSCDPLAAGLDNQLYKAARQFQLYRVNPGNYNHKAGRVNNILFHPNTACGSSPVLIKNQATAGLYNYTPYQPNAASLGNLYGTGDGCSSYGNRNFWRLFTDWFTNPGNMLTASSFEASVAKWGFANGKLDRLVTGPTSASHSGQYYLSMYAGTPSRSLSQDVKVNAPAGSGYDGSIWVKSGTPGVPFRGVLAIWGLGGRNEVTSKAFTVGDEWTKVSVSHVTKQVTSTIRLEVYLESTDALLSLDTTQLTAVTPKFTGGPIALSSPSFESGISEWGFANGFMNRQLYNFGTEAHEGSWILATNTAAPNRSLKQDVRYGITSGETVTATVWMRSDNPTIPARGTLALWGMGSTAQAGATTFSVGSTWTPVTAILDATASGMNQLRLEIYLESTDVTLFIDDASMTSNLLHNANFAAGVNGWTKGTNPGALVLTGALPGRAPLSGVTFATTSPAMSGGSFATDLTRDVKAGETYQATIWLRSADPTVPFTGTLALWGVGGATEGATAPVSVGSQWQPFTVTLPAGVDHTSLRVEVYTNSPGIGVDVGTATLFQRP